MEHVRAVLSGEKGGGLAAAVGALGALWGLRAVLRGRRLDLDDMPQARGEWPWPVGCVPRLLKLDNHEFLRTIHEESGPVVHMNLGAMDVVSVADFELVKTILSKPNVFVPGERLVWQYFRPLAEGLIMLWGEQWRRERNVLSPAFGVEALAAMEHIFARHTATALDMWTRAPGLVDFSRGFGKLTLDIICHAALGQPAGALAGDSDFPEALDGIMEEVQLRTTEPVQVWRVVETARARRFRRNVARIQQHADRLLEQRLGQAEQPPDMLGAMIGAHRRGELSREALRHEAIMVMVAGNDTSAISMSFAARLLAAFPDAQHRARSEVRGAVAGALPTLAELDRMPFLTAVVKEALRLYPSGYVVFRALEQDADVGGYALPKGTQLFISVYAMHRDPKVWGPDVHKFRPERFLPGGGGDEVKAFMPFSWGTKMCPGRHLSMAEIRYALASLLLRCRLELPEGTPLGSLPDARIAFALRPRENVLLRVTPLDPAAPEGRPA